MLPLCIWTRHMEYIKWYERVRLEK